MNRENYTAWRKATRSGEEANCVQIAPGADGTIGVRDSKNTAAGHLALSAAAWSSFITGVKAEELR